MSQTNAAPAPQNASQNNPTVTYRQLLRFFLPVGATPFLIASSHTIVNAGLARLPLPELSIAVYTVVKSLTNAVKAPDLMTRQASVSLIDDRHSYRMVMGFSWILASFFLLVLLLLGFTQAGEWALRNLIGLTDPTQIAVAYTGLRIAAFLPLAETLRNSLQGIAIGLERTRILPVGTLLRLVGVSLFLWWAVSAQTVTGIVAATGTWLAGIALEGVMMAGYLFWRFGTPGRAAEQMPARNSRPLQLLDIVKFFAPLAVMMTMNGALQPVIQSGLARSASPTLTLAAYGVAWGLIFILTGPVRLLHQCSLVYTSGTDDPNWTRVRRFSIIVGVVLSLVTLAAALSPLGYWLLAVAIAVSPEIARTALPVLVAFSFFPLVRAWRELYWGMLMHKRRTSMIGGAKAANLTAVVGMLALLFGPLQSVAIPPAVAGALVYTLGELVETIVIWWYAVQKEETLRTTPRPAYSSAD